MDWTVLGIEPTADKKAITKAYRTQLMHTNPEDKPEEFKVLRETYEQALSWASRQEDAAKNAKSAQAAAEGDPEALVAEAAKTPEEQWLSQLTALYANFQKRIDPALWRNLLTQDVAVALDSRPEIEMMLLLFLLHNGNLPQEVWQVLEDTFKWSQRREELCETYPRPFVDHLLIDGAKFPPALPFQLFSPGENAEECDAYLDLYLQAGHCEWKDASQFLDKMDALSETHPYGRALRYHYLATQGDGMGVVKLLELTKDFPEDEHLKEELAETYADGESWEQCEAIVRELLESNQGDRRLTWLLAQSLAGQQRFAEGVELLGDLMHAAGGDQKELMELSDVRQKWNESLIEQYEQRLEQGDCSDKLLFELAWCYLQNERDEESVELIDRIDPENIEPYEYYNLSSQAFLATERYERAFEDSKALVEVVRAMQPDGTERTRKRMARLAEMIARCGDALYAQKHPELALPYYQEAAEVDPDNPERLTHYSRVMASLNRWPEAAQAAERLIDVMPGAYHAHYLLAQYYFEMHNDRDAFYQVNYALELEKGDLGVYVLRLRILLRNGALQQAADDLRFLEDSQCGDYLPVLWCKALYAEATDEVAIGPEGALPNEGKLYDGTPFVLEHGRAAALAIYREIYERLKQGEEMDWPGQACFRLAILSQDEKDASPEWQLEVLDKGLELDPNDADCLSFRAWLLRRLDRTDDAIEAYLRLAQLPHDDIETERALAQLYGKNPEVNAQKALDYYQQVLEQEPNDPVMLYYAGLYAYFVRDFSLAESYFLRERAVEPESPDSYRMLSFVYEALGRYDDALRECDGLLLKSKAAGKLAVSHYLRKALVLRRAGRARAAVETLFHASFSFAYDSVYADVADVLLQFGLFDQLRAHLDSWGDVNEKHDVSPQSLGGLAYYRALQELLSAGSLRRAKHFARTGSPHMNDDQRFQIQRILAAYARDFRAYETLLLSRIKDKKEREATVFQELSDLALLKWYQGNAQAAVQYAQEAVAEIDALLLPYSTHRRHFLLWQAAMFALLGQVDQMRDALAQADELPLCERCGNGACCDSVLFKALAGLIQGDVVTCCELVKLGRKKWPGSLGFACLEQELKRQGEL